MAPSTWSRNGVKVAGVELGTAFISVSLGTGNLAGEIRRAFGNASSIGTDAGKQAGGGFKVGFGGIAGAIGGAIAGIGLGKYIGEAARASDATDKFKAALNFSGLGTKEIEAAKNAAKGYADQTVYDLPTIQNMMAQLASNGEKDYTRLTQAAGNLNAVAGGNADTFKSVAMVMTQTAGAGKLTTENWNQLADAIPGGAGQLQKALEKAGAYTGNFRDAMANGDITAKEFNDSLLKLGMDPIAVEAAKSTATFEGALGNLNATINSGLMSALDKIKPAVTGAINGLATGLGKIGPLISGVSAILFKGDFTAAFSKAFNIPEDSPIVDMLFKIREGFAPVIATAKAFGPVIGQVFSSLGPQVVQLITAFSPLGLIFKAIQPVLPQIVSLFSQLALVIGSNLSAVLPMVTGFVGQLATILGGIFVAIMPSVVQLVRALSAGLNLIVPAVTMVIAAILPLILTLVSQLAPIFTSLVTSIMPIVISSFLMIASAVIPLVKIILSLLVPVIKMLMPLIVNVFNTIANVVKSAMQIVKGVIQVVTSAIKGDWNGVWNGIKNILQGVWGVIKSLVSGAINAVKINIQNVTSGIKGIWEGVWNNVKGFVSSAWTGIKTAVSTGIEGMMGFIRGIPGKIQGALSGAAGWLVGIGKNIIDGLISGISSMMGAIGRAILNIVPAAIRGPFEAALGIHSPSRVFKGYGINIGQGLIQGVDKMEGKIKSSMENMVALPAMPSANYSATASGFSAGSAGAGQTNNFNLQAMDAESTAVAVARRLATQIA
jgi:tape measure domain-containing protein